MGAKEYLAQLDLEQLKFTRDKANELIAKKESEPKRVVWCLEDRWRTLELFANYVDAAEKLLEQAKKIALIPGPMRPNDMELHLTYQRVPISEYADLVLCR